MSTTKIKADIELLRERARFIRTETVRLITIAKSGHYTSIFSAAEILSVLYYHVMQLRADPLWPDRDRLIMSKGHVAVGVYPVLADKGFFPKEWLDNYARLGRRLAITRICAKCRGSILVLARWGMACRLGWGWRWG